jgi:hypothetical protein
MIKILNDSEKIRDSSSSQTKNQLKKSFRNEKKLSLKTPFKNRMRTNLINNEEIL